MKQFFLLAALLLCVNFAHALELKCPSDTKQLLYCEAATDSYIGSAVICLDSRGKLAIQFELRDNSLTDFFPVKKIARTGATSYVGADFSLVKGVTPSPVNATLYMNGRDAVKFSCKR